MLTVPEAAVELRISESKMYALIKADDIKSVLVGPKSRRVPRTEIEAYIARLLAEQHPSASHDAA